MTDKDFRDCVERLLLGGNIGTSNEMLWRCVEVIDIKLFEVRSALDNVQHRLDSLDLQENPNVCKSPARLIAERTIKRWA